MMHTAKVWTIIAVVATAAAEQGPPAIERLAVGSAAISAMALQPYVAHYKETIVTIQNVTVERALWTDELKRISSDGRDAWQRHIEVVTPEGKFRETVDLIVDARTFAPIKTFERSPNGSMTFSFMPGVLTGTRVNGADGEPRSIAAHFPEPFFDYYGGMMELFLSTLPFKAGYRATFPVAMATTDPSADASVIDWPIVEMKGEEAVTVAGTSYRAWRAEVNTPYGFYRVWVRKEPPFVVRTILLIPPGGRITYDFVAG